jgi:cellulase (glycosyl hydrolase family 5)
MKKLVAMLMTILMVIATPPFQVITLAHGATVSPGSVLVGWGGDGIKYVQCGTSPLGADCSNDTASAVFPLEPKAPKLEMLAKKLFDNGYNAMRVSFDPPGNQTSNCGSRPQAGQWGGETQLPSSPFGALNLTQVKRAITIATYYYMSIVIDYHSTSGLETASVANRNCWLNFWSPIIRAFAGPGNYTKIIWEPINEPTATNSSGDPHTQRVLRTQQLSNSYQLWLNQARGLGDSHPIIIENLCSLGCANTDLSTLMDGWPSVNDTLGKIFESIHPYYRYRTFHPDLGNCGSGCWTNSSGTYSAESVATSYYDAMLLETNSSAPGLKWPILNTEGGTGGTFNGTSNGLLTGSVSDIEPLVYDSNVNGKFDSNSESTLILPIPNDQQALRSDAKIKYVDSNNNNHWDTGEPVVYDSNTNGVFNTGESVLYGTPGNGASLKTDSKLSFWDKDSNNVWTCCICPDVDHVAYNVMTGSAGYCATNFHFLQSLTQLLDNNLQSKVPARINWVWYPEGPWASDDTPASGTFGALSPNNGYGKNLSYKQSNIVTIKGDLDGTCKVDIVDLVLVASKFGKTLGQVGYEPVLGDHVHDTSEVIDVVDLSTVGSNFGQYVPGC